MTEFNYKKLLKIDRTKSFQRFVERRKATFEVIHYRGFLRKSVSLGKGHLKLDAFLDKSEVHEVIEVGPGRCSLVILSRTLTLPIHSAHGSDEPQGCWRKARGTLAHAPTIA